MSGRASFEIKKKAEKKAKMTHLLDWIRFIAEASTTEAEAEERSCVKNKLYWIIVGTRPEVIKQIPVYRELVARHGRDRVALIGTGQHRELLDQALAHFGVTLDLNLDIMKPGQSLSQSSASVLSGMGALLAESDPEWVIVQGDTTSAAMAAWASFLAGVPVAHNEAGLRSNDLAHPFPEEANRKLGMGARD
ncbi:MAG: hypothetical protein EBX52_08600, partial [Proteobacteria bacterium]|nr:hypothetical protein [Pseudomonadota bacterium]